VHTLNSFRFIDAVHVFHVVRQCDANIFTWPECYTHVQITANLGARVSPLARDHIGCNSRGREREIERTRESGLYDV
jgi:hypothetical protein